uniref:Uncharacterized protein n=1 Tax=Rhizophora mucronata TaxID=61149 RepID=A0A2P2NYX1_RHIMU
MYLAHEADSVLQLYVEVLLSTIIRLSTKKCCTLGVC